MPFDMQNGWSCWFLPSSPGQTDGKTDGPSTSGRQAHIGGHANFSAIHGSLKLIVTRTLMLHRFLGELLDSI